MVTEQRTMSGHMRVAGASNFVPRDSEEVLDETTLDWSSPRARLTRVLLAKHCVA